MGRRVGALLVAAGRGERLGRPENKAFVPLGGRPLVSYALEALRASPAVAEIVLVVAAADVERARRAFLRTSESHRSERVVAGGADRSASVRAGLEELGADCDTVLIHDGARPFLTPALLSRCLEAAEHHGAVVAGWPCPDTVKSVGEGGRVAGTLDRSGLWLAQTPQVFRRELLVEAHARAVAEGISATDDAALVERLGRPVYMVRGDPANFKITTPEDLAMAEQMVAASEQGRGRGGELRCGIGYDAHRFGAGRELVLGGVRFDGEPGLVGHSDADVLCHAICDALLGAVGAGDIGQHFPDTDPRYAGISSLALLAHAASLVRASGWEIVNVDSVVVAERPRLAGRLPEMRRALAEAMEVAEGQVSVKGKTTEGMGFTGRGEGIAAHAICLVTRRPVPEQRSG